MSPIRRTATLGPTSKCRVPTGPTIPTMRISRRKARFYPKLDRHDVEAEATPGRIVRSHDDGPDIQRGELLAKLR